MPTAGLISSAAIERERAVSVDEEHAALLSRHARELAVRTAVDLRSKRRVGRTVKETRGELLAQHIACGAS